MLAIVSLLPLVDLYRPPLPPSIDYILQHTLLAHSPVLPLLAVSLPFRGSPFLPDSTLRTLAHPPVPHYVVSLPWAARSALFPRFMPAPRGRCPPCISPPSGPTVTPSPPSPSPPSSSPQLSGPPSPASVNKRPSPLFLLWFLPDLPTYQSISMRLQTPPGVGTILGRLCKNIPSSVTKLSRHRSVRQSLKKRGQLLFS